MRKKSIYRAVEVAILLLVVSIVPVYSSNFRPDLTNDDIVFEYPQYTTSKLLELGDDYYARNEFDSALVCYNVITKFKANDENPQQQRNVIEAYNQSAAIHYYMSDFRSAYELLIKALLLSEKLDDKSYQTRIYNNLGAIYAYFKKYDMAQLYYEKALSLSQDSIGTIVLLNNLGTLKISDENADEAFNMLNRSKYISQQCGNEYLDAILNSIALYYKKVAQPDSSFHYFRLALKEAQINNHIEYQADNLSGIGQLFFENNRMDSALHYITLSNKIASENRFLAILAENHLTLSKIYKSQRNIQAAFSNYEIYANLKDSVFNAERYGEISQLQRLYEVSKTNQQIEQLVVERQVKENTIYYQRVIQYITLGVLSLMCVVALFIYIQKKNLNKAYKVLVEKNLKIMALQENRQEEETQKQQASTPLQENMQTELLNKILAVMEDTSMICDADFSLDKLAELVGSNRTYVSQVINTILKKNFRAFLNEYRIREAQRLFLQSEASKHTIEFIASQAGFKSPSTFRATFKEVTGVSPSIYLRSLESKD